MNAKIPQLTLTPELETVLPPAEKPVEPMLDPDLRMLTPEERAAVEQFAEQIDIANAQQILTYGAAAQKNIADFSESALESVRTKDMGEIGDMLTELEIETLPLSAFTLAVELGSRFLGDYLLGDPYFVIRYPDHNLVRARCQLALARDIWEKLPQMQAIVGECVANM